MSLQADIRVAEKLLLTATEAAALLGMGRTTFAKTVAPHIRVVIVGKGSRYPRAELERWIERAAVVGIDLAA